MNSLILVCNEYLLPSALKGLDTKTKGVTLRKAELHLYRSPVRTRYSILLHKQQQITGML